MLRGFQHDHGELARMAIKQGLVLRKRTAAHALLEQRVFVVRYGLTLINILCQQGLQSHWSSATPR